MAKISETELQKRLRKLEASISDPSDTVILTDDQYTLTENVIYVAYASALSNLTDGTIPNQSDATDFQYSPYNIAGVLMPYRGYFSSTSIYPSGDPTDYLWESTTGLTGFESSERYHTTSSGFRKSLGNPTEPGDGITWTVISPGAAVPGTAIWLAERYTVTGITSGWSVTSVAAYVNSDLLIDASVTTAKLVDDAVTAAKIANSINTDIATGVAALPKSGGAMTGAITTNSTFDGVDIATRDAILTSTTTTANAALPKAGGAMTGAITTNSTFDGRDIATDGTKLDGIEASADVTDATNVTAAGALMDSECAGLAAVKATTGTFLTADQTKLDAIEASADVTDATNVTAAGALMDSECTSLAAVKAINQSLVSTASPTFVTINATTVDLGNWTVTETGGVLFFATGGVNKMKLEASGNLTCVGTVTESGSM